MVGGLVTGGTIEVSPLDGRVGGLVTGGGMGMGANEGTDSTTSYLHFPVYAGQSGKNKIIGLKKGGNSEISSPKFPPKHQWYHIITVSCRTPLFFDFEPLIQF